MQLYIAKRTFRLLLPLYFAVFSVMPLANIHIEGMQNRSSYLFCKARQDVDRHLLLHELLFAHFGNKSEHLKNSASVRFTENKEGFPKDHPRFTATTLIPSASPAVDSKKLIPPGNTRAAQHFFCFVSSGLSPPSV